MLTEELAFDGDDSFCVQFICEHACQPLLEEREDGMRVLTGKAGQLSETAKRNAFNKVDIKGQI